MYGRGASSAALTSVAIARVDAVERLERLDPLGAAVVGELVVVGEVGVDDVRAAVHLLDDQRRVDVAQQDVAGRAHARRTSSPRCICGWMPGPPRPPRLDQLLEELAEEQRERAQVAGRAEEERPGTPCCRRCPATSVLDRRGREVRPRRVAGHQVADAGAVVREQALAVRDAAGRSRAASTGLLETIRCWRSRSYQRNAGIPSLLPCRMPAWLADVIDGRIASQRDSLWLPSRTQPRHRVDRAGPHPAGEDRVGEPVDLDDHEARLVRVGRCDRLTSRRWTSRP